MGNRRDSTPAPVRQLARWVRSRSVRERVALGALAALVSLVVMRLFFHQLYLYYMGQAAHAIGLFVLGYKLTISKNCSGLSLKTQELTAISLVTKLLASFYIRADIHVILDTLTLVATLWVIYMIRFKLKATYLAELDNMPLYYVLVPSVILGIISHPLGGNYLFSRLMWSVSIPIQAVAVLPQLRLIQNAKMVEPFTAHYVFALGVARFFACATWIFQIIDSGGGYLKLIGSGNLWILFILLCEVVQTFILADFCYYYVKSIIDGQIIMRIPSSVV